MTKPIKGAGNSDLPREADGASPYPEYGYKPNVQASPRLSVPTSEARGFGDFSPRNR